MTSMRESLKRCRSCALNVSGLVNQVVRLSPLNIATTPTKVNGFSMAELQGTSRTNFTRDTLTLNFGWRHRLNEHAIWIASLGHELRTPDNEQLALVGYCGIQLVY